jgi:hypothetical protein
MKWYLIKNRNKFIFLIFVCVVDMAEYCDREKNLFRDFDGFTFFSAAD